MKCIFTLKFLWMANRSKHFPIRPNPLMAIDGGRHACDADIGLQFDGGAAPQTDFFGSAGWEQPLVFFSAGGGEPPQPDCFVAGGGEPPQDGCFVAGGGEAPQPGCFVGAGGEPQPFFAGGLLICLAHICFSPLDTTRSDVPRIMLPQGLCLKVEKF